MACFRGACLPVDPTWVMTGYSLTVMNVNEGTGEKQKLNSLASTVSPSDSMAVSRNVCLGW